MPAGTLKTALLVGLVRLTVGGTLGVDTVMFTTAEVAVSPAASLATAVSA